MNTYGNSAFPMNTYAAESGYYPTGAEFDPEAPWNRTETIEEPEIFRCCDESGECRNEVPTEGEVCPKCLEYLEDHK